MATARFEIHARRWMNKKGERSHLRLERNHIGGLGEGFDCIELWVDDKDVFVLYIDNDDYPNFPTYDSNDDSKGATTNGDN